MISIVCAYNDKKLLGDYLLRSLKSQKADYELIALDNTRGRFKSAANALNHGGRKAKGKYIMFVHQDVDLPSGQWLMGVERALDRLPRLGIAGVAGNSGKKGRGVTNIRHGFPPQLAGGIQIRRPEKVQTLDEYLVIIPRKVFERMEFDEQVCDGWHLYAVDYALSVKKLGLDAYALPAQIYHISAGASMSGEYYATLEKLLKKHRGAGWIYTTCGFWNALIPVGLQRIRIFQLATAGLVILFNNGPGIFLKTAHSFLTPKVVLSEFTFFLLPYAYMKTKTAGKGADLGELFDFAFYGVGGLIKPSQIKEEFLGLLGLVRKRKPKVLMEIGTNMGGSLYMLAKAAPEDATIISIDLPGGKYGGGYPLWKMPLYRSFARAKQGIHLIRGDSHKAGTLEKAKGMLAGRKVDFLFIDADHSYAGVKRDFEMYGPLVANGGVIAFHDIVVHPMGAYCDVNRFWARIKRSHRHVEMVKDWGQRGFGIGVIFKP